MKGLIEISNKTAEAGKTPVKFILHQIYNSPNEYNGNGVSWNRQYTEQNMYSVKGMPLTCQFADDEHDIPFGGHGEMSSQDSDVYFEDSLVVGSFEDSYIDDNLQVDGDTFSGLVGEAYIYNQRFPQLVQYLQEQYNNKLPVDSSVEICADKSKGNSKIIYDGGWKEKGRVPKDYQYSGQALCIGIEPADNKALMIELNSKQKEGKNSNMAKDKIVIDNSKDSAYKSSSWNVDKGSYFRKCKESANAMAVFNEAYLDNSISSVDNAVESDVKYPHHHFDGNKMVVDVSGIKTAVQRLAQTEPNNEAAKSHAKKHYKELGLELPEFLGGNKSKGEMNSMEKDTILELNQKIENKTNEINSLTTSNKELTAKNVELNETVVNANKTCEELNAKISSLTEELNACKSELESKKKAEADAEAEAKKAECNSYFKNEIPKDGFTEEETKSLKPYVDKADLEGLKAAEAEICTKKFKASIAKSTETNVETNSANNSFISIPEVEKKVISDSKVSFFD